MQIALTVPNFASDADKARAFRAALEANARANEALATAGRLPDLVRAIKAGAVRWAKEPPGHERFDIATTVAGRGWGDCDDLAPWWAAQLRHTGQDRLARPDVIRTGDRTWHAIVRRGDGSVDDPSRWAGMRSRRAPGVMAKEGPTSRALALTPTMRGTFVSAVQAPTEGGAIVGIAEHPDVLAATKRAYAAQRCREDHVGFGPALAAALPLATAALPMAQGLLGKVMPGMGAAAAPPPGAPAPQVISPPPGAGGYGPIIVRF